MIAVDTLMDYGWRLGPSCHLIETNNDMDALDAFAASIGCKRSWRDKDHYDLVQSMRRKAVAAGAVEVTRQDAEYVSWLKGRRR